MDKNSENEFVQQLSIQSSKPQRQTAAVQKEVYDVRQIANELGININFLTDDQQQQQ